MWLVKFVWIKMHKYFISKGNIFFEKSWKNISNICFSFSKINKYKWVNKWGRSFKNSERLINTLVSKLSWAEQEVGGQSLTMCNERKLYRMGIELYSLAQIILTFLLRIYVQIFAIFPERCFFKYGESNFFQRTPMIDMTIWT